MKTIFTILFLSITSLCFGQNVNGKEYRIFPRTDSVTTSNIGKIAFDADDDKLRFNDGTGWFSYLKEGATLPYWPTSGNFSTTGAQTITTGGGLSFSLGGNFNITGNATHDVNFGGTSSGQEIDQETHYVDWLNIFGRHTGFGSIANITHIEGTTTSTSRGSLLDVRSPEYMTRYTGTNQALVTLAAGDGSSTPASYSGRVRNLWITSTSTIGTFMEFNPNAGTGQWLGVSVEPAFNTSGTFSGTARGFYYNPTLSGVTGLTNIAFENTSGLVRFGEGIQIDEGTNETMGIATLTAGTVTVNTTKVTSNSRIFLTVNGGTITNVGTPYVSARVAATSFTITSTNGSDASDVAWIIIEPAP